mmetsp:Transcript_79712/g.97556  ORF Transcript_79712/g.97556 Transcript_79712/m.97556 type:complete len:362 (-) Transcript_79712:40-1125(-)
MALAKVLNTFGLELFKHLSKTESENVLISPLSLSVCMSMVTAGATPGSNTEKELLQVLGPPLSSGKVPSTAAQMANSAWVKMGIKPEYVQAIQADFGASAETLPGTDPAPINEWVKSKTQGLIPELFSGPLDPLTVLVLVNTIFFKGAWATVFDPESTTNGFFQGFTAKLPCDMMYKKEKKLLYAEMPKYQALQLPYNDRQTLATIILPKEQGKAALDEVVDTLHWDQIQGFLKPEEVKLSLPRFRVSAGGSMVGALKALGIKEAFEAKQGFLKMSDDPLVYLNEVMHKATVMVNEEGTVAAAATGAVMATRCLPPPVMEMTVDRPFLFVISDVEGAIFFLGKVVLPELAGLDAKLGGYKA